MPTTRVLKYTFNISEENIRLANLIMREFDDHEAASAKIVHEVMTIDDVVFIDEMVSVDFLLEGLVDVVIDGHIDSSAVEPLIMGLANGDTLEFEFLAEIK